MSIVQPYLGDEYEETWSKRKSAWSLQLTSISKASDLVSNAATIAKRTVIRNWKHDLREAKPFDFPGRSTGEQLLSRSYFRTLLGFEGFDSPIPAAAALRLRPAGALRDLLADGRCIPIEEISLVVVLVKNSLPLRS